MGFCFVCTVLAEREAEDNKEKAALKAIVRRLCEPKKDGRLQVPQDVHDAWVKAPDALDFAIQYRDTGFNKDRTLGNLCSQDRLFMLRGWQHVLGMRVSHFLVVFNRGRTKWSSWCRRK